MRLRAVASRDDGKEARALTVEECDEWLGILDADAFAVRKDLPDLARFLLGTGCRLGEAVGVHWNDVDLDRQVVHDPLDQWVGARGWWALLSSWPCFSQLCALAWLLLCVPDLDAPKESLRG